MDRALARRNRRLAVASLAFVAGMVGLSYAAVPLYDLFCRVTGYGGTTQTAEQAPDAVLDRVITVRFNADINNALAWDFAPVQRTVRLRVGEQGLAFYTARNLADAPTTGQATFNVTPNKAGEYFVKVDCFCFTEQTLQAGQAVDMPVAFYVDPEIVNDRNLDDVNTITLSYTFFEAEPSGKVRVSQRNEARQGETSVR